MQNVVAYLYRAKQKSGKAHLFTHFDAKSDDHAETKRDFLFVEAGYSKADYFAPVRIDFPVVDDLPAEGEFSETFWLTWALEGDTGKTCVPRSTLDTSVAFPKLYPYMMKPASNAENGSSAEKQQLQQPTNDGELPSHGQEPRAYFAKMSSDTRATAVLLHGYGVINMVLTKAQMKEVITKSLDKDSSYISTMLDALRLPAVSVMEPERFAAFVAGVGRRFEEGDPNVNLTSVRNYVVQLLATEDFQHKYTGNATKPVEELPRTESGALLTNGAEPTTGTPIDSLQMLETVIGCALYPSDFDIANPPGAIIRAVTEMKKRNDEALKVWNEQLSATPGVLRFSRQAIVALVRGAAENLHVTPGALRSYINANLIEVDAKPAQQNTETVQQTGAEVQHAASNPGEKDEVVTEFETERCAWLRAEIRAALAGTTGVMDESDVTELTASVGEDISHSYIARLLAKEIEPCDPFNQLVDDDVHHLTCDILENWQDKKAPRVAYIYSRVEFYLQEARRVSEQKCQEMAADIDGADSTALQQENPEPTRVNASNEDKKTEVEQHPGELSSMGGGRFDVSELFEASPLAKVDDAPRREEPAAPAYFEPGRYLDIPNEVYHSANGISSTMAKDARISLMYYHGRHVIKTIQRERTDALTFGSLVHALALEPEKLDKEFSVEPVIPEGAFTDTASMRAFIEQHNATLPKQADADTLRAVIEKHNATLPAPYALGGNADEIGQFYMMLPPEFQSIPEGAKITATAMKACIKEYNTTLPAPLKTTGGRDALLEQLATIEPEFVEKERSIPAPLPVSGSKEEMAARIKTILPTAVFADEVISAWKNSNDQRQPITQAQMKHAKAIQHALLSHPKAGQWLQHPQRATEVSYFGIDEETGLEVRVRPDLEIDTGARRIAVDLKTVSLPNVKQDNLRYRLHREIIERDYHMSASMYCDVGMFDQFFWIFVNKEPGYHWVAVVETSADELALGRAIYKQQLAAIRNAMDTGIWPEPITEVFTDTLTDYELSRLKELNGEPS